MLVDVTDLRQIASKESETSLRNVLLNRTLTIGFCGVVGALVYVCCGCPEARQNC